MGYKCLCIVHVQFTQNFIFGIAFVSVVGFLDFTFSFRFEHVSMHAEKNHSIFHVIHLYNFPFYMMHEVNCEQELINQISIELNG